MEIWVTLLTVVGALLGTWLTTWLVGRQSARDLRTNVDRDIEILSKLKSDSEEAKLLSQNISKGIAELVGQDDQRRRRAQQDYSASWLFGLFSVTSFAVVGLATWRSQGFWEPLRYPLEGIYWGLWFAYAILLIRVLLRLLSWTKGGIKLGAVFVSLGWWTTRLGWLQFRKRTMQARMRAILPLTEQLLGNAEAAAAWDAAHTGVDVRPEARAQRDELSAEAKKIRRKLQRRISLLRLRSIGRGRDDEPADSNGD